ncbi:MAG: RDD family protein [Planctomycetaceae bacterium]|nr:RDD family protein [Planctomycetaceae bacterium]
MTNSLQFETPENVQVQYKPAGLGTRFLAWFIDQFLVWTVLFVLILLLTVVGTSLEVLDDWLVSGSGDPAEMEAYVVGVIVLLFGLGSFVYFTAAELFMHGQTVGKRASKIRVVKLDGFSLDAGSIFLRNVFRVIDNIPVTWIIPVMSKRSQRMGDMASGTIVVSDEPPELTNIRVELSGQKAIEAEFRFDSRALGELKPNDIKAVEQLLERWQDLPFAQRNQLAHQIIAALAKKMNVDRPPRERELRFLEDLLAAELRRQNRLLG